MALSLQLSVSDLWRSLRVFGTATVAVLSLAIFPVSTVSAQEDDASADEEVEEIVVTGSRIRRNEFTSASPIQVIDMERTTLAGLIDTADILQGSTVAASAAQINNLLTGFVVEGGSGVNTLDLRGAGPGKTLVLMNGRRLTPAGTRGQVAAVDLNTVPASIIKRIEVLKDGASSIYGSDAVTGVVNIITRDDLDGFAGAAQSTIPNDGGGEIYSADIAYGFSGDNFNVMVGAEWFERRNMLARDRSWSECTTDYLIDIETGERTDTIDPATGEFKCYGNNRIANDYVIVRDGDFAGRWIRDESVVCNGAPDCVDGWRIGSAAERKFDNPRALDRDIISPAKRLSFFSFGNLDIDTPISSSPVTAYYEYLYNSRRSKQTSGPRQFAPGVDQLSLAHAAFSPFAGGGGVNEEVPLLLPYDQDSAQEVNWTRVVGGLKGAFGNTDWDWDIYYSYGRSNGSYGSTQMLVDRVSNSLDIVEVAPGQYDCRVNVEGNQLFDGNVPCVVMNPYAQIGQIDNFDPAVLEYITSYETGFTTYTQNLIDGYVTGNVFELPAGPVPLVLGFQYREEKIDDRPSSGSINGNLWGFSSSGITQGTEKVNEIYGETEIPILRDVIAFQELYLSLSGRWTDYKTVGDDTTYKVGLNWQIIDQFRLRGAFGTSFRAPALYESFLGGQTAFFSGGDPCEAWDTDLQPGSPTAVNCATETPAGHVGFTSTPKVITFGNAGRLVPETSENLSVGAILSFDSIGLSIAVDYFDLEIDDEIDRFGGQSILNQCYGLPADQFRQPGTICDFLSPRDPVSLNIDEINDSYFNINSQRIEGFDYTLAYNLTLGPVDWQVDFRATQLDTRERTLFGGVIDDFNSIIEYPDWNAQFDLRADWNNWTFFYNLDWIGEAPGYWDYFELPVGFADFVLTTDDVYYHGISARYSSETWAAQIGVTNLTDEEPPLISRALGGISGTNAAFYTGYDLLGTSLYLNFQFEF
jgi:iron complex outermembrane receptor protein